MQTKGADDRTQPVRPPEMIAMCHQKEDDCSCDEESDVIPNLEPRTRNLDEYIQVSPQLVHEDPQLPKKIKGLVSNYLDNVFSDKIGKVTNYELDLNIKPGEPIRSKPYLLNRADRQEMDRIIDEWLEQGIIRKCQGAWSSPAFLIKGSKGKKSRLVINYQKVNQFIQPSGGYSPHMEDVISTLGDGKIMSLLDIRSAYLMLKLSERSQDITGFVTHRGHLCFNYLPFGLSPGSFALADVMTDMLYPLRSQGVVYYADDVAIVSNSMEEHLSTLKKVFDIFKSRGVTLSLEKCQLFQTRLNVLGVVVENGSVCIDPSRIESIQRIPAPKTRKGLLRLLGMLQFIARWIPQYQDIIHPLSRLRSPKVQFIWDAECQAALQAIKDAVCHYSVLKLPNLNKPFVVFSDSSKWALSGYVGQRDDEGNIQPVGYFSRKLREADLLKPIFCLEMMAVAEILERYRFYLFKPFELWVDNRSLAWCLACPKRMSKYGTLLHRILAFNFEVRYLPSFKNVTADFLSRMYCCMEYDVQNSIIGEQEDVRNMACINLWHLPWLKESIGSHQREDDQLKEIIEKLEKKQTVPDFMLVNKILCKRTRARANPIKICVPKQLVPNLISYYHNYELGGHAGYLRTLKKISSRYTWNKMAEQIGEYVTSCLKCQLSKRRNEARQGQLESKLSSIVNGHWFVDTIGRLPRSSQYGYSYVLIIVDACSKVVTLEPMRNLNSKTIIDKLYKLMLRRGFPHLITTDNASVFTSTLFKEFMFCNGIKNVRISPHHAAGNISERYVGTFKDSLRIYCNGDHASWEKFIYNIEFSMNRAINTETKYTPFDMMYRHNVNDPLDVIWEIDFVTDLNRDPDIIAKAFENMQKSWVRRKRIYDQTRIPSTYQVDDKVLIKKHVKSSLIDKFTKSLEFKYEGPFVILRTLTPNTFLVKNVGNDNDVRRVHVTDVKRFIEPRRRR